jgi:hypothetical protein
MAESLQKMHEKYPDAKYRGVQLSLNWTELKEARRDGDGVWYWSINWQELWIDLHFTTEPEDED